MPIPNLYLNMRQRVLFTLLILTCAVHAKPSHVTRTPKKARTSHLHNKKKSAHEQGPRHTQDEPTPTYQKLLGGLGITALLFLAYKAVSYQQGPIIPPNQQNNTQQNNNIAQPNQPNQPNNISANSPQNTTPQPPPKPPYILTKEDIDTFYDLNKDLFDLDELIKTQKQNNKDWQLDDDKMNQWVARMQNAWQHLSKQDKNKWFEYWWDRWVPDTLSDDDYDKEQDKIDKQNILYEFAKDYTERLRANFVTWDAFKNTIEAVAKEAADKMQEKAWQDILFFVPSDMATSTPWIFFVFWKYLKNKIPDNATCHFIDSAHQRLDPSRKNTLHQSDDTLVFMFSDTFYAEDAVGSSHQYFIQHGVPKNFYVLMPYTTHRIKRELTQMDPMIINNFATYYDQSYVKGTKPHHRNNENESTWFQKSPVQFMPSTQVFQEILIKPLFLGGNAYTTTPVVLPYDMGNNFTTLPHVHAYGVYPMGNELTETEVQQFDPISFFKGHDYKPEDKPKIRKNIFSKNSDSFITKVLKKQKTPENRQRSRLRFSKPLDNKRLPIQPLYKNRTFTFQVKENNTIVEKQYSNADDLQMYGVFEAIKHKRYGQ